MISYTRKLKRIFFGRVLHCRRQNNLNARLELQHFKLSGKEANILYTYFWIKQYLYYFNFTVISQFITCVPGRCSFTRPVPNKSFTLHSFQNHDSFCFPFQYFPPTTVLDAFPSPEAQNFLQICLACSFASVNPVCQKIQQKISLHRMTVKNGRYVTVHCLSGTF